MNEIRLIIYVVLLIISIISLVKNNLKKQENRKISKETRESLNPVRVITKQELDLINTKYKFKGNIDISSNVYKINGPYTFSEISHRGGSIKTHFLGPHEIYLAPPIVNIVSEIEEAEVVFTDKNIAVILEVPGLFSVLKETEIFNELNGDGSVHIKTEERTFEKINREMTENELNFLNKDIRVFPALLLFSSLIIPAISINTTSLVVSGLMALLSLILYLRPMSTKLKDNNRIVRIRGNIKKNDITKSVTLDRFLLKIPKHWNIESMDDAVIEGYAVDDNALTIDVLKINNSHSIEREAMYSPIVKKGKLTLLSILLLVNTFIVLVPAKTIEDMEFLYNRYKSKDLKVEFVGFDEINSFDYLKEQRVEFSDFNLIPYRDDYSYKLYLVDKNQDLSLDFQPLLDRLNGVIAIQNTYFFIQIVALGIDDYFDSVTFINDQVDIVNEMEPNDYYSYFKENSSYAYLADEYNNLANEDYEVDLYQLQREYNRFFEIEADYFNDMIENELKKVDSIDNKISIDGLDGYYELSQYLDSYDLKTYFLDYSDNASYKPIPSAFSKIDRLERVFSDDYKFDPIHGTVLSYSNKGEKEISIYTGSYDFNITPMIYRSVLGLLVSLLFIVVLFFTVKKYKTNL